MSDVRTARVQPLVVHPQDTTARTAAWVAAAAAGLAAAIAAFEAAARSLLGTMAAAVVALVAAAVAAFVAYGRAHMEVRVSADLVVIGRRRLRTADIAALRRHGPHSRGIDIVDAGGTVLYAMPGWFSAEQEAAFGLALGRPIEAAAPAAAAGDDDEDGPTEAELGSPSA